jgi:hypothetical protein
MRTAFEMDDQEAQPFLQMETPPRRTSPNSRKGETLQSTGANTSVRVRIEEEDESESGTESSDSETKVKRSPHEGKVVLVSTKVERAGYILDELQARSKETVQRKQMKVEDEVKGLSVRFAGLTVEEWIATGNHFAYAKKSAVEQTNTDYVLNVLDSNELQAFQGGPSSSLRVSH